MGNKVELRFVFVSAIVLFLVGFIEWHNGRFHMYDLVVYHSAAEAFVHGQDVYGQAYGVSSGFFKYSPAALYAFIPLSLLELPLARAIHFALLAICAILCILLIHRICFNGVRPWLHKYGWYLFALSVLSAVHWHRELLMGNVNLPVLLLVLLALDSLIQRRWLASGLALSLVFLFKPHFVLLLPLLVWFRRWKTLGAAVGFSVVINSSFLLIGGSRAISLFSDWFKTMQTHNASLIYVQGQGMESINTAYTVIHRFLLAPLGAGPSPVTVVVLLALIALFLLVFLWRKRNQHTDQALLETNMWILACALVPSLTLTDTNHFIFSLPLVALLLHSWPGMRLLTKVSFVLALFLYSGNWVDLWGSLSSAMRNASFLGIGNLMLIVLGLYQMITALARNDYTTSSRKNTKRSEELSFSER